MKPEELMIGDLIIRRGVTEEPMRLYDMKVLSGLAYLDLDGISVAEKFENIEPIPLTPEILEKNGWILKEWSGHKQFQYIIEECGDEIVYKIDYIEPYFIIPFFRCNIEIKYVHELQHALKLCKIEKEIIL